MKRLFTVFIVLLLILVGCTTNEAESSEVGDSVDASVGTSSEEQSGTTSIVGISLEQAGLFFSQTYSIELGEKIEPIVSVKTKIDECTLEICDLLVNQQINGEVIFFGIDEKMPMLVTTLIANDSEYASTIDQASVIWRYEMYTLIDLNSVLGIENSIETDLIKTHLPHWIFDESQIVGMYINDDLILSTELFDDIDLPHENGMISIDFILTNSLNSHGRGVIYLPELNDLGEALSVSYHYAEEGDVDYNNVILAVVQIMPIQGVSSEAFYHISNEEYSYEELQSYAIGTDGMSYQAINIVDLISAEESTQNLVTNDENQDLLWMSSLYLEVIAKIQEFYEK